MPKVLIVDDHVLFREGLVSLLRSQADFEVLGEAGTVREAIQKGEELQPDLILMDFSLPDGTGLEATKEILGHNPKTNIVILTMHEEDDRLFAAIRSGARGYLLKNIPVTKLLASLRGLTKGEAPLSRRMTGRLLKEFSHTDQKSGRDSSALDLLTLREQEILQELSKGRTNSEIAQRLFISENTVKNHVHNILDKLNLNNRREASRFAQRFGSN